MGKFGWSYPAGCTGPPHDDVPIGCYRCNREPPCDDDGEPDYSGWIDTSYCSAECRDAHEREMRALREAEVSLAADWAADEMAAEEYWRSVARETPEDIDDAPV